MAPGSGRGLIPVWRWKGEGLEEGVDTKGGGIREKDK